MLHNRYIALILMLLLAWPAMAQVGRGNTEELTFTCSWDERFDTVGGYLHIGIADMYCDGYEYGKPALPTMSRLLMLPRGTTIEAVEWSTSPASEHPVGRFLLIPMRGATIKDEEQTISSIDKEFYSTDTFYRPGDVVSLACLGTIGEQDVYRITVSPFAYNPARGLLQWSASVSVRLTLGENSAPSAAPVPERLLIVSRPEFAQELQPFVRWKRQEGYDVDELYVGTSQRDSIKALMQPYFASAVAPSYVLLVGDAAHLQSFIGYSRPEGLSTHLTDMPYGNFSGDYLPEAVVGRWPVADTAELHHVVDKTLSYEQCRSIDTATLRRVLLVAGAESSSPAPTTTNGQVNYVGSELAGAHPAVDTLCYYNPASGNQVADILSDIRQGVSLLNYTAHCSASGWTNPRVDYTAIDTLTPHFPLVYVNNCCKSNDFTGSCLGSELLLMQQGGAVGVIGATNSTLWNEDYYWAVGPKYPFSLAPVYDSARLGAFDRWLGRNPSVETLGDLLLAGNMAVSAFGSPYDRFYWETYCILGDPSLRPYVGVPQQATVGAVSAIAAGCSELSVSGATPGAMLSVVQGDVLLGTAVVAADGTAIVSLSQSVDTGTVLITLSGYSLSPQVDTIVVAQPTRGIGLFDVSVTDSAVSFSLANFGVDTLLGVNVAMVPDSLSDYSVSAVPLVVDTLLPSQRLPLTLSCSVDAVGMQPWWQAHLSAAVDSLSASVSVLCFSSVAVPSLTLDILDADSNAACRIDLDSAYIVLPTVSGPYDSLSVSLTPLHDSVGHLHLSAGLYYGNWSQQSDYYLVAGDAFDGFEHGLNCYPWTMAGTQPWRIDSTVIHGGRHSLRSGAIEYRQTSDLVINLLLPHDDSISFWTRISSEPHYDKLYFYIDGSSKLERWGDGSWRKAAFPLSAGAHTLRWRYVKDESTSQGSDCAWLDDVSLPLALWLQPYGCLSSAEPNVSVSEADAVSSVVLYPNPATAEVSVVGSFSSGRLLDLYGRVLAHFSAQQPSFSVAGLPAGVYLVELSDSRSTSCLKLIVNH